MTTLTVDTTKRRPEVTRHVASRVDAHSKVCKSREFTRTESQWLKCRLCGDPV